MLRRLACLLLSAVFPLALFSGCTAPPPADDDFHVVVTFYPLYIAALNLIGEAEGVNLELLAPADTGCPHDYRLRPRDMELLETADLLILNGLGLEGFLGEIAAGHPDLRQCVASESVVLLFDGHEHDHDEDVHGEDSHDDEAESVNPHAWVSVENYIWYVGNIADALSEADPAREDVYRHNEENYCARLTDLRAEMETGLSDLSRREMVTFHEAFSYFADEFDLEVVATVALDPGTNPSPRQLAETVDTVRSHNITALFAEPAYSSTAADTVARETGATVYELNPVTTGELVLSAYEDIQRDNLTVLRAALG